MSIKRKIMAAAAAILLMTGIAVASGATPAFAASGHEMCDEGLPVKCINAWGGGPDIKVYSPNVSNNNFTIQGVNRCNNGDYTTSNCPIAGNPSGLFIYQIKFSGGGAYNGRCVGDNATIGYAHLVNCNSTSYPGTGGGTATIFVQFHGDGNSLGFCSTSFNYAINSHHHPGRRVGDRDHRHRMGPGAERPAGRAVRRRANLPGLHPVRVGSELRLGTPGPGPKVCRASTRRFPIESLDNSAAGTS
jgi:hypothetical protein